jgi:hypothetical protein
MIVWRIVLLEATAVAVPYSRTNNGNQVSLSFDLCTENTEAGLFTVEGDTFYRAGETFYGDIGFKG